MSDNRNTEAARHYHDLTKHSYWSIRASPHYLDWANKPSPFKIYPAIEPIPLPRGLVQTLAPAPEVVASTGVAFTVENACAPADGPIAVTGFVHVVLREQDGVFYIHNNWQMSGVSANGTRYEGQRSIEVASATGSFSYSSRTRWVSQGPSDNMYFTFTAQFPPGTFSMETDCRG